MLEDRPSADWPARAGAFTPRKMKSMSPVLTRLFVVCGKDCTENDLEELFSPFGKITTLKIGLDRSQKSRGFAFIDFETAASAAKAIEKLHGTAAGKAGQRLKVSSSNISLLRNLTRGKVMIAKDKERKDSQTTEQPHGASNSGADETLALKRSLSPTSDKFDVKEKEDHGTKRYRNTHSEDSAKNVDRCTIFFNSHYKYTRQEIEAMFRAYGGVQRVQLVKSHGLVKTMAYIKYFEVRTLGSEGVSIHHTL